MVKFNIEQSKAEHETLHGFANVEIDELISQSNRAREISIWISDKRGWHDDEQEIVVQFFDTDKNLVSEARTLVSSIGNQVNLQIPTNESIAYLKIQKSKR